MKTTSLPSVEEVTNDTIALDGRRAIVNAVIKERDNQAYTSLVEGIEGMELTKKVMHDHEYIVRKTPEEILTDILEKVVKPLYGKK